jgi:MYXO-CTERM domain-containing protein
MFKVVFLRRVTVLACSLLMLLIASSAMAAGRVEWKSKRIKPMSDNKSWRVEITIYLPKAPDTAHIPMKFEFEPLSYFERSMVDGDKIVERTVPLSNVQALIESVDVGFLDSGSGKIESRTRFSFKVTRAHGYESGEYMVKIRDSRSGAMVGTAAKITFEGENEVIDRRSIVFTGGEGKKKKKSDLQQVDKDGEVKKEGEGAASEGSESAEASDGDEPEGEPASGMADDEPGDEPESVEEKPGGCGCRVRGEPRSTGALWLGLFALAGLGLRRRRFV